VQVGATARASRFAALEVGYTASLKLICRRLDATRSEQFRAFPGVIAMHDAGQPYYWVADAI
jgi:hypothetical protein